MSDVVNVLNSAGIMIPLPLPNLAKVFAYDGSGNVTSITVAYQGSTYQSAFTYDTSGNVTNISQYLVQ